jgi:RNA polymerase sigma-70 factor, ECF subfamily
MEQTPRSLLDRLCQPADPSQTEADWASFVELFTPLLYDWARRQGLNDADAADLVQDVFLQLVRVLPTFRHDGRHSFRGWLFTLLRNRWRDRWRARPQPAPRADLRETADPAAADPAETISTADYARYLQGRALQLAQRDFEPSTWRAFWACVVEERPPATVAAELGLTPAAVYKGIRRVRLRLRQELEGFLD